eukprot:m.21780 g.21780  ORF g.21780 m.21780 type:complete len:171 (+) comp13533_c0_seq1:193-705(+)
MIPIVTGRLMTGLALTLTLVQLVSTEQNAHGLPPSREFEFSNTLQGDGECISKWKISLGRMLLQCPYHLGVHDGTVPAYGYGEVGCDQSDNTRLHLSMINGLFGSTDPPHKDCEAWCIWDLYTPDELSYSWDVKGTCWRRNADAQCGSTAEAHYARQRASRLCAEFEEEF